MARDPKHSMRQFRQPHKLGGRLVIIFELNLNNIRICESNSSESGKPLLNSKTPFQSFNEFIKYFNTFGGNAVAAAAANAVLCVIENENLMENAEKVGGYILEEVKALQKNFPILSDVRGYGLFIGIELMTSEGKPNSEFAYHVR